MVTLKLEGSIKQTGETIKEKASHALDFLDKIVFKLAVGTRPPRSTRQPSNVRQ